MPSEEKRIWGIHTKDDNLFLHQDIIAIGWKDMGDLSLIQADRDAFKEKYTEVYPDAKKGSIANGAGMLYRFTHEVENYADEYLAALDKGFKKNAMTSGPDEDESVGATADEIIEATRDFILKELSKNLKGYDLEEFVADLLRAMGYRTTVSSHGGDSGIDITAYKDELPPRILVQVKSQDSDIKEATIQSLKGAMREGDYGLFVTLSNYTKNAQKYLDSTPIIRGINGTELVDLILKYYHDLSDKYKKMIPLKMIYIPVPKED